jgi:hypothetical protein
MKGSVSVPGRQSNRGRSPFSSTGAYCTGRKAGAESGRNHGLILTGLPWMAKGVTEYKTS